MSKCKRCQVEISWYRSGDRWLPLNPESAPQSEMLNIMDVDEVRNLYGHRCSNPNTVQCRNGCGSAIYFDRDNVSSSGKMIPMEVETHENHSCPNVPKRWK